MLIEILSEDKSGAVVVERLAERIVANEGLDVQVNVHPHRGCGSLPKDMTAKPPKFASSLLDLLPSELRAYNKVYAGKELILIIAMDSDDKDPQITVDTDTDAYVFAAVKDNINNNTDGIKYVDYDIADGWIKLTPADMQSKTIQKYLKTFAEHKTAGSVAIDPQDATTKIYYRVVHGTNQDHEFGPFSVLKDDQVHYPSTLTNADLDKLAERCMEPAGTG